MLHREPLQLLEVEELVEEDNSQEKESKKGLTQLFIDKKLGHQIMPMLYKHVKREML